ncbi:phosphatidylglycerol lysyltransferase domain-containing protein [Actinoplanes sp. NPDC089786]|uniref:phosphatidylglycerol lysyltransferase domain-containing protein n=1 Tax=Actinoplanes sp. NPDC089786 TaxID=3155185 RepID=UPI00343EE38F
MADVDSTAAPWRPQPPLSRVAVARLVQLAGAYNIIGVLMPSPHGRLGELAAWIPTSGVLTARAASAASGLLLIYLGAGLRRGKHRAWQVAVVLAGAGVVLHLARGWHYDAAGVSAALLVMLIIVRHRFHTRADPWNRWRALIALLGFGGAGFVIGLAEIALRATRLEGRPGLLDQVREAGLGLVGLTGPLRFTRPVAAEQVSYTTGAFGLLAIGVAVVLLLRPANRLPQRTRADDDTLRQLLRRHGESDSLGYFALRPDKSLFWTPSRRAVIAYRVINGVSLASGDPIGPASEWPQVIAAWLRDCAEHGWTPAVLGCGAAGGKAFRKAGLDVVELGDEAILDVATFSVQGRALRSVRQAVGRVERAGFQCQVARLRDLPAEAVAEAKRSADAFRDGKVERGFSMALSRIGDPRDGDCLFVICRDAGGQIRGLLQFVPWGAHGLSLDLMRGDRTAENGLTEFMVVSTVNAAREMGGRRISLNFAVLRSIFARADELGAGPFLRLTHRLLTTASKLWQIESLYRSNAKYQPTWSPRYLCFPVVRDLPRIAVAALSAEAFLPRLGWRR